MSRREESTSEPAQRSTASINDLAEQGAAVLMISSEIEEVLGLAHRVLVMRRGSDHARVPADPPLGEVMEAAFGLPGERGMTIQPPNAAATTHPPTPRSRASRGRLRPPRAQRAAPEGRARPRLRDRRLRRSASSSYFSFALAGLPDEPATCSTSSTRTRPIGIPACAVTLDDHRRQLRPVARRDLHASPRCCAPGRRCIGACWWCFPVAIVSRRASWASSNGAIITKLRVNAFLATLATALAFSGLALAVSGGLADHPRRAACSPSWA